MNNKNKKILRIRRKISGNAACPRLAIFRSLKHLSAQLVDDNKGFTLVSVRDQEVKKDDSSNLETNLGKLLAKKALEKKITKAVLDRRGNKYHGKIKAIADGARAQGLKI